MELDDAYDNSGHIAGSKSFAARWQAAAQKWIAQQSRAGRARLAKPYGDGAREVFDLFPPHGSPQGLVVFVHGGCWRGVCWMMRGRSAAARRPDFAAGRSAAIAESLDESGSSLD